MHNVTGTILDWRGRVVRNALVTFMPEDKLVYGDALILKQPVQVQVQATGRFSTVLAPGVYTMSVLKAKASGSCRISVPDDSNSSDYVSLKI